MARKDTTLVADERIKKTSDDQRDSRSAKQDQAKHDAGLLSDAERERLIRSNEWLHEALPAPPKDPNWHFCWLTTASQYDPIAKRLRIGYELVKADDYPGYEQMKVHSGQYPGCIMVNEMILARLPIAIYNSMMVTMHHKMPHEEETSIREGAQAIAEEHRDSKGQQLLRLEEGMESLGQYRKPPSSFE